MDTFSLAKFTAPPPTPAAKRKSHGAALPARSFMEFYVNERPLSAVLDSFYGDRERVLDNNVGVLGSFTRAGWEAAKIKQLTGKKFTVDDFDEFLRHSGRSDEDGADRLDRLKDEIADPDIIIYCCARCGDYYCGGVTVKIAIDQSLVTWTFTDNDRELKFEFDKYAYLDVLKGYLRKLVRMIK